MKRKTGITLIELLVTIVVMGVVAGLSVPVIRNINQQRINRKYSVYLDSLVYASKLYTDSYSTDLFGFKTTGCSYVKMKDLKKYNLIKDIDLNGVSCNSPYTAVKVVKFREKYYYKAYIGCGSGEKQANKPDIFLPEQLKISKVCDTDLSANIIISANPAKKEDNTRKKVKTTAIVESETGVSPDKPVPDILYGWSYEDDGINIIGGSSGWKKLEFKLATVKDQEKMIAKSVTQVFPSVEDLETPAGVTGKLNLVIYVKKLYDLQEQMWTKISKTEDNYVILGPFMVDNSKPIIEDGSSIVSSVSGYQAKKPKLNLTVKDDIGYSEVEKGDFKFCYSYDTEPECQTPTNAANLATLDNYQTYSNNKVLDRAISNAYDGSTHTVKVVIADAAGNWTKSENYTYRVGKKYTLTFDSDGGSACSPSSIGQIENHAWNETVINESGLNVHSFCNPTKNGYTLDGWYTGKNGTGTKVNPEDKATADLKVYAKWKPKTVTVTFNCNGGTGGGNQTLTYGTSGQHFNQTCSRTGYTLVGWKLNQSATTNDYSVNNGVTDAWINGHAPTETLYAHWTPRTLQITFDCNGGTGGGTQTVTYGASGQQFNKTCSRTGYVLKGWKLNKSGTTNDYSVNNGISDAWIASHLPSVTIYAHWGANTYTITYAGNGSTGGSTASQTCTYGNSITMQTNGYTRTGYTFNGWSQNLTTCPSSNTTVNATWKANTYTVSYAGNGATGGSTAASSCTYGQSFSPRANGFTRTHYYFNGWSGSTTCTGNMTMTATWAPYHATIRYHTGTSSGSKLKYKPDGWSIKNSYQIWNSTSQDLQTVNYGSSADPINYHNTSYLYIMKTSSSNGTAKSGKEWEKCDGSNCARSTYNQATEYTSEQYCNTSNGNCVCCIKVNWN